MAQALALKYRPQGFDDLTEQEAVKIILKNQLDTGEIKHGYLFCGSAGCGKTTSARIFASEINKHRGNPIELDAASNNSVDDIRRIISQSQTQPLDCDYKVFIIDETHMLSTGAFNAFLKTLEEPPAKSIFIMCTTDPQKIPKTILSRVQRFDFTRISHKGIVDRLCYVLDSENVKNYDLEAVDYIAKLADGGMRDALTLLDKALNYSDSLTLENVVAAIGTINYGLFCDFTEKIINKDKLGIINIITDVYNEGKDLKQFIKQYLKFILDVQIFTISHNYKLIQIPRTYESYLEKFIKYDLEINKLLKILMTLYTDLRWEVAPKTFIESRLLIEVEYL